jgi:hypothetical protein
MADIGNKELRSDLAPTDALKDAGQQLLGLLVQRAAQAATERVSGLADRLTSVGENGGRRAVETGAMTDSVATRRSRRASTRARRPAREPPEKERATLEDELLLR